MKKNILLLFLSLYLPLFCLSQSLTIDQKVDSLLSIITLEEKIGQMTQAERGALDNIGDIAYYKLGSLLSGGGSAPNQNNVSAWADMYDMYQNEALKTRLGIPLIYGVDAVHGHNNVYGAVIFPHNIGLGSTWNAELVKSVNEVTAKEVAATGIDWTFSPCITVPQNERWGRTYEGFGETAEIQKIMAAASVIGLQGEDLKAKESILACAKHWVGDGGTTNGTDQGNTEISEEVLREIHMSGYIDAINANVGTIMASYNSWNGQKLHGHDYLLNDVLKEELGFEGFIISDWKGVDQLTDDYRTAVKIAINAGIDMVMVPDRYIFFISILKDLVEKEEVSMARIDDAVSRILKQKFLLNLFEEPLTDRSLISSVGSAEHRLIAKQAVRESLVLLSSKNDVLPLRRDNQKILVAGSHADDLGAACGGWSISWQGSNGEITEGTTILEGIQQYLGSSWLVYAEDGETSLDADIAIVVIGEDPYAESGGDRSSLNINDDDVSLIKKLKSRGIPVVTILISGRPMIISELLPYTDAFIAAWLPGTEGDGVAELLFGDYEPKGILTHTWPRTMSQIPINFGDADYDPLFEYKHGLQSFPTAVNNTVLLPYASIINESGDKILLTLTDKVSTLSYTLSNFSMKINGEIFPNAIASVSISSYDSSILEINLNNLIEGDISSISISYNGYGIASSGLMLIPFDDLFVYNGLKNLGTPQDIPGRIEAESYYDMNGIATEDCSDVRGGLNVGWINNGDWMKYQIEATISGEYVLTSRIAGYKPGTLYFSFNDSITTEVSYDNIEGWQDWKDFQTNIYLEKGIYTMKVFSYTEDFNINYFDFDLLTGINDIIPQLTEILVYPNPAISNFFY